MKKTLAALLVLGLLTGCQKGTTENKPTIYTYIDHTPGVIKQYPMESKNYELKDVNELQEKADLIMIANVSEVMEAKYEDERFKTPHQVEVIETIKGEAKEVIDEDGGRMTLLLYKHLGIEGKLSQAFVEDMPESTLDQQVLSMMPANFYDLESGQTYLFFVKDGEILNEGYGVFEKLDDTTYQNVISKEEVNINDLK